MVKIRLSLQGSKKNPFYKIIVADSKCPRDGKFIEKIGFFTPKKKNKQQKISVDYQRINYWIKQGAQLTKTIQQLIKKHKKIDI
ncbi:30S ribosomal protein S16 [Buchnera aphidicola]|uniref:Small ribosomal subunit protein bS16 n=1 Tax=Buchnera aphidicola (Sarucallis kahawaluokalani) TaxID=1241878 RepID=A0A4D6Y8R4_9GAMM|nr:30S ribosomal protein S16 [Buchnera aphidicola]QCI26057.1 30S ribosomal protein S16 [Buchnera aphidicola (Sarucallis kahawaluokalani)]